MRNDPPRAGIALEMYPDASRVLDARAKYFATNGFSDATYGDNWVHLKLGPIPLAFPNTASRKRAVPLHDLHHVATEYPTTLVGESEIGSWEIAGGCANLWAAWVLNALAFSYGLVLAPRRVYRAFIRGRHGRPLYRDGWRPELLELTVGELRARLAVTREIPSPTLGDRAAFAGWVALVALPGLIAAAVAVALLR